LNDFGVAVEHLDGTVVLRPFGELDIATAPTLQAVLETVIDTHLAVVVDLSGVSFVDCGGLRPLRLAVNDSGRGVRSVRLFAARPAVERVLVAAGLQQPVAATRH